MLVNAYDFYRDVHYLIRLDANGKRGSDSEVPQDRGYWLVPGPDGPVVSTDTQILDLAGAPLVRKDSRDGALVYHDGAYYSIVRIGEHDAMRRMDSHAGKTIPLDIVPQAILPQDAGFLLIVGNEVQDRTKGRIVRFDTRSWRSQTIYRTESPYSRYLWAQGSKSIRTILAEPESWYMRSHCDLIYSTNAGDSWHVLPLASDGAFVAARLIDRTLFIASKSNDIIRISFP
ncbi:MAG: hypothetical protein H6686_02670 [Fibrobacteria bacterium]|nr:hypothetical protein [Fibrobacteria bacterium]